MVAMVRSSFSSPDLINNYHYFLCRRTVNILVGVSAPYITVNSTIQLFYSVSSVKYQSHIVSSLT